MPSLIQSKSIYWVLWCLTQISKFLWRSAHQTQTSPSISLQRPSKPIPLLKPIFRPSLDSIEFHFGVCFVLIFTHTYIYFIYVWFRSDKQVYTLTSNLKGVKVFEKGLKRKKKVSIKNRSIIFPIISFQIFNSLWNFNQKGKNGPWMNFFLKNYGFFIKNNNKILENWQITQMTIKLWIIMDMMIKMRTSTVTSCKKKKKSFRSQNPAVGFSLKFDTI